MDEPSPPVSAPAARFSVMARVFVNYKSMTIWQKPGKCKQKKLKNTKKTTHRHVASPRRAGIPPYRPVAQIPSVSLPAICQGQGQINSLCASPEEPSPWLSC